MHDVDHVPDMLKENLFSLSYVVTRRFKKIIIEGKSMRILEDDEPMLVGREDGYRSFKLIIDSIIPSVAMVARKMPIKSNREKVCHLCLKILDTTANSGKIPKVDQNET